MKQNRAKLSSSLLVNTSAGLILSVYRVTPTPLSCLTYKTDLGQCSSQVPENNPLRVEPKEEVFLGRGYSRLRSSGACRLVWGSVEPS